MQPERFSVERGPADPWRGLWYLPEKEYANLEEAIDHAAQATGLDNAQWGQSWMEYGWEWSVFRIKGDLREKVWEGFQWIQENGWQLGDSGLALGHRPESSGSSDES